MWSCEGHRERVEAADRCQRCRIHRRRRGGCEYGCVAAKDGSIPEKLSVQTPTEPRLRANGPASEPAVALGMALRVRANEIAQVVLETWAARTSESYAEDERVRRDAVSYTHLSQDQDRTGSFSHTRIIGLATKASMKHPRHRFR